jgi:oligopeptidase A
LEERGVSDSQTSGTGDLSDNPLLAYGGLPRFDAVRPEHVVPAVRALLDELTQKLEALEKSLTPSWSGLIEPLERMGDRLGFTWGTVGHLMGVQNSDALRDAYETVQGDVVMFGLRQGQSRPLFDALTALGEGDEWGRLDEAQQRIVESLLRESRHAGVALEGAERDRFNEIQQELAKIATEFNNHVLDATKAYSLTLSDPAELAGTPESLRQLAAQSAREAGEEGADAETGPWRLTLDSPSIFPFLEYSERRDLREQLYRAYISRAGSGELDNAPLIARMLALRLEESQLLGYPCYADLSLSSKMAPDVESVSRLLEDLREASYDRAVEDLEELRAFARERGAAEADDLRQWDIAYYAERLREERFDYSEEQLRPYFPLPKVLDGLFGLAGRLFGVSIEAADGEAPVWHSDVRFFRVRDADGGALAAFYLDPYSRPEEKRGGAWMDECVSRSRGLAAAGEDVRLPVAHLVCNQTPPVDGRPSLMSFGEVTTLFHEFGHGLQHMLTEVDRVMAAGIRNIEWDAVELPSQFMENWCYQRETLHEISGHVETGEPLPDEFFEKILAARTYRAGSDMLRQLYFACTDLELHHHFDPGQDDAFDVQRRVAERTTVLPPLAGDRFLCSFGHIFGGGYAAGYYSYKWAEVLSADAFGAFEEAGLDDSAAVAETGRRFRETVLALGGSRAPMEVFRAFRGREPRVEALLRHSGLLAA